MASAMYPPNTDAPPPAYSVQQDAKIGVPYQQHVSPGPAFVSPAQPFPGYAQPMIVPMMIGRQPVAMQCPRCQQQVVTVVQYENGSGTWLISLLICLFGGIFGCCLIPFCVPDCKDVVHTCPSCQSPIGRRNVF